MSRPKHSRVWKVVSKVVTIRSRWVTLICEKLLDDAGNELEYWRAEKPGGVIVITIQGNRLLLPPPMYRPGIGRLTLDFCGGRMISGKSARQSAVATAMRELKIKHDNPFISILPINKTPWNIDSSFTNAELYGFVAVLSPEATIDQKDIGAAYSIDKKGIQKLLNDLTCLQCRAVLREWLATSEHTLFAS